MNFHESIKFYVENFGLDSIANFLRIGKTTISRWANGISSPHEVCATMVLDSLENKYKAKKESR